MKKSILIFVFSIFSVYAFSQTTVAIEDGHIVKTIAQKKETLTQVEAEKKLAFLKEDKIKKQKEVLRLQEKITALTTEIEMWQNACNNDDGGQ